MALHGLRAILLSVMVCMSACNRDSVDDRFWRQCRDYTRKYCPLRMDEYTMLDSLVYVREERCMNYYYLLEDSNVTDARQRVRLKEFLEGRLLSDLKNNTAFRELRENDISFRYHYRSSSGKEEVMMMEFGPNDYK